MENNLGDLEIRKKINEYYKMVESLEKMIKAVLQEQDMITGGLIQIKQAILTLGSVEEQKDGLAEMIIPVGGSAFIKGKMDISPKAMVKIGSDLVVEKSIPDVKETLEGRGRELEMGIRENEERLQNLKEKERNAVAQIEDLKTLLITREGHGGIP